LGSVEQVVLAGCTSCKLKADSAFCNLPPDTLALLDKLSYAVTYPQRVILFSQEQPCRGVFILCSGKAKVSAVSRNGKPLMIRIAESGEVLGLSAAISGVNYDVTAETLATSVVRFMKREDFIHFLQNSGKSVNNLIAALGREYEQALDSLRSLALLDTATARVAQLLLKICSNGNNGHQRELSAKFVLTQEQIAQMTATTRETVTRLLVQLRRERVISIRGSNLIIRNRRALEKLAC
jgi:CRP/FNR family transcriptional regulator, cyclic AMP receptor protein